MRRSFAFLVLAGCATTPAPRISFDEATRRVPGSTTEASPDLDAALSRFLVSANQVRLTAVLGQRMPERHAKAWAALLDEADRFGARKANARWTRDATRARLQLESEFQTDARTFGDIPLKVAERVPRTLRALSLRITALTARVRKVDPRFFSWPVTPLVVSSPYGSRVHPILGEPRFHAGIDLEAPMEQPVVAAEVGTVVFSAWNGGYGNQIEVQHDAHWATRYAHLEVLLVKPGTVVKKGQLLGLSGQTGMATGPHLHFELRRDGDALDPESFLESPSSGPPLISVRP